MVAGRPRRHVTRRDAAAFYQHKFTFYSNLFTLPFTVSCINLFNQIRAESHLYKIIYG